MIDVTVGIVTPQLHPPVTLGQNGLRVIARALRQEVDRVRAPAKRNLNLNLAPNYVQQQLQPHVHLVNILKLASTLVTLCARNTETQVYVID